MPDHSTFLKNRHGRFRQSDAFRHLFESVLRRCMKEGLVGGEGFAIDASVIKADASRARGVPSAQASGWTEGDPPTPAHTADEMRSLQALMDLLERESIAGAIPGAVAMVSKSGRVLLHESCGWLDGERTAPMPRDAVFWIASMSKPIVSAAALQLCEQGLVRPEDPLHAYLPDWDSMTVEGGKQPDRPIRIEDLLHHTCGLTYGAVGEGSVGSKYVERRVFDYFSTNAEVAAKLSRIELAYEPGSTFEYGMSTDVLGRVVEVCSGTSLHEFLRVKLFEPLGMQDTTFRIAAKNCSMSCGSPIPRMRRSRTST